VINEGRESNMEVIFSSLISGLLGVIISNIYHKRNEVRRAKLQTLKSLLGNRYDITGDAFTEVLNELFVVFYDSKEVIKALKDFHEVSLNEIRSNDVANIKLLELFKAMCSNLKINQDPLTDNFFLLPFNTRKINITPN
jgi:hypothetical protein